MLNDVYSTHKCCASCEFWNGSRQLKPNAGGRVFQVNDFTSVYTVGLCVCGRSINVSRERSANSVVCNNYQKWQALK